MNARLSLCGTSLLLFACGGPVPETPETPLAELPSPAVGDPGDSADRACQIVLREVSRRADGDGRTSTDCSSGACVQTWTGVVEVAPSTLDRGGVPAVLVGTRPGSVWVWRELSTTREAGGDVARFRFNFADGTLAQGPSATAVERFTIAIAPFVRLPDGGRAFDHNRIPGALDTYVLARANDWSVGAATEVCPGDTRPLARLQFEAGWHERQAGAVVSGGRLRVNYDPARLPQCAGARYQGRPAWSIVAYARYSPSGTLSSAPVVGCDGAGCADNAPLPFDSDVPVGSTGVDLWFYTSGRGCPGTYDSNFGRNYHFEVASRAPAAVGWAGDWGSSFSRECSRRDGVADPVVVDSYTRERACMMVFADVWAPGVTDGATAHPEWLDATVEWRLDGGALNVAPLEFDGRAGNNLRWRWTLPRQALIAERWSVLEYHFAFATNGRSSYRIGRGGGPGGGAPHTIERGPGF